MNFLKNEIGIIGSKLCKEVYCVDLGESLQMSSYYVHVVFTIYLQKYVSIQPRTSPAKFALFGSILVLLGPKLTWLA